jgi:hypothetical protein
VYYTFDSYGWYTAEVEQQTDRSTTIAPPTDPVLKANWTGYKWVLQHYTVPVTFVNTQEIAPITMRQARLVLDSVGLLDTIDGYIKTLPKKIQIEWEFNPTVHRNNPLVVGISKTKGLTDEQLDELFIVGATL